MTEENGFQSSWYCFSEEVYGRLQLCMADSLLCSTGHAASDNLIKRLNQELPTTCYVKDNQISIFFREFIKFDFQIFQLA